MRPRGVKAHMADQFCCCQYCMRWSGQLRAKVLH